jgi:hypothetical protein
MDPILAPTHAPSQAARSGDSPSLGIPRTDEPTRHTERTILDLLRGRYSNINYGNGGRWSIAEHVRSAAGFDATRTADFVALDMWPSKGLELHGHEVKVSRSDWLHELAQPEKCQAVRQYCNRWWLVVSDRAIVRNDLPDGWGLMAPGRDGQLRVYVTAPTLHPVEPPRTFWVALTRAVAKTAAREVAA